MVSLNTATYGVWHSPITSDAVIQNVSNKLVSTQKGFRALIYPMSAGDQDPRDPYRPQRVHHLPH